MGQGDDGAGRRPVLLAVGNADAFDFDGLGWAAAMPGDSGSMADAFLAGEARIALVDLRGRIALPRGLHELGRAVARGGGALVALGAPALLHEALRAGATHFATDAAADALSLALASAARHVERLAMAAAEGVAGGWSGPGGALARVEAALAGRPGTTVLLVALERFDVVNAAYGRAAGDQVLGRAALRIARAGDEVADAPVFRVGGSEFVVLPAGDGAAAAARVAARLSEPFVVPGAPVTVGHRIAATGSRPGESGAALLDRLRGRMQAARADAPEAADDGPDRLAIDLHLAIERGEIELLFQPQVALAGGRIVGVEALARWAHPRLGMLGAEPLLAAAARAGLAGSLSAHIQALALGRAAGWTGPLATLRLSINVTAQDVAAPGFAARFLDRLAASGFPPARLTAEVTETGLILDLEAAAATLAELRRAGVRVALDDFGTGYSSLAYLKALPVDVLKIDRAIVRDVTGSPRDRAVLDGVIAIARALGLATVAEGVETPEQRDRLATMGCDLYQGFLCAEPVHESALAALMEDG